MVRIRLRRVGAKKQPSYRIVVIKSDAAATGRPIETIGHFNARTEPETFVIKEERALHWLGVGAQPSEPVLRLLKRAGIWDTFTAAKAGVPGGEGEEASDSLEEVPAAASADEAVVGE